MDKVYYTVDLCIKFMSLSVPKEIGMNILMLSDKLVVRNSLLSETHYLLKHNVPLKLGERIGMSRRGIQVLIERFKPIVPSSGQMGIIFTTDFVYFYRRFLG